MAEFGIRVGSLSADREMDPDLRYHKVKFETGVMRQAVIETLFQVVTPEPGWWRRIVDVAVTKFDVWIGHLGPGGHSVFFKNIGLDDSEVIYSGYCMLEEEGGGENPTFGIWFRSDRDLYVLPDHFRQRKMAAIRRIVGEVLGLKPTRQL